MITIAVTEPEYSKAEQVFRESEAFRCEAAPAAEDELAESMRRVGARHVVLGVTRYEDALYRTLPRGGVIARFGVGHDGIDKRKATEAGLLCTNTPGVLTDSVAEYTITLILAAARRIAGVAPETKAGSWASPPGWEVAGKTLAVIGCGAIGRRVAQIASFGLRMKVVGCETAGVDPKLTRECGFSAVYADFAQAVAGAAFVSLHIPGDAGTAHFINEERLRLIPPTAWLINTARGSVLDEVALFDALSAASLAGAALDVFEAEPYRPRRPGKDLRKLDNVLLMPHCGSNTVEANQKMARRALRNIELAEAGRHQEMDLLNPDVV